VNDNAQEIVELKRNIKIEAPNPASGHGDEPSFMEQMTRWPYLSTAALGVAIAALFLAIR